MNLLKNDREKSPNVMENVAAYFEREGLIVPYISPAERSGMIEFQHGVFGSKQNPPSIYDIDAYVQEVVSQPTHNYVMLGFMGHGVQSFAVHYYAVQQHLAFFIQLAYGGVWTLGANEEAVRDKINGIFSSISSFITAINDADIAQLIPDQMRLLIVESDFYGRGWEWINGYPGAIDTKHWHTSEPTLMQAFNSIPQPKDK